MLPAHQQQTVHVEEHGRDLGDRGGFKAVGSEVEAAAAAAVVRQRGSWHDGSASGYSITLPSCWGGSEGDIVHAALGRSAN